MEQTSFIPVSLRSRGDGWTAERQRGFVAAWDAALADACATRIAAAAERPDAWSRAVVGVAAPVFYGRRQVGEVRRYDDAAMLRLLRAGARRRAPGSPHAPGSSHTGDSSYASHASTERASDAA